MGGGDGRGRGGRALKTEKGGLHAERSRYREKRGMGVR